MSLKKKGMMIEVDTSFQNEAFRELCMNLRPMYETFRLPSSGLLNLICCKFYYSSLLIRNKNLNIMHHIISC